jgi:hypothetical protein
VAGWDGAQEAGLGGAEGELARQLAALGAEAGGATEEEQLLAQLQGMDVDETYNSPPLPLSSPPVALSMGERSDITTNGMGAALLVPGTYNTSNANTIRQ